MRRTGKLAIAAVVWGIVWVGNHWPVQGQSRLDIVEVEGQPLAANVERLIRALDFLGYPLPPEVKKSLEEAILKRDARRIQELLDPHVLVEVNINPESRVKAKRGPAEAILQQGGYVPVIIKVINESTVTKPLRITSPQAGPIFSGGAAGKVQADRNRFLDVETFTRQPMTPSLSGLKVEYVLGLIHSSESGKREATLRFDVGQGTEDLGFRGEVPILFTVRPAIPVRLRVRDWDGQPTVARLTFKDRLGRVYPPQAKRLAPDFFFQEQIYRSDGGMVYLPPGRLVMEYCRGPEYRLRRQEIVVPEKGELELEVRLERWINMMEHGYYCGDHHIHAAGCAHYTNPTEGVFAEDMFLHVKGEGLNVGCVLTWGPCFEFQRQFFEPRPHKISEPFTVLKYDIEVSGFGSQALGHVCLLNLRDQTYPGSEGTKEKGWPTYTTPVLRWAKAQGAVTGYAHSANGLQIQPENAAKRLLAGLDQNKDGAISRQEAAAGLLPEPFAKMDRDADGQITADEALRTLVRLRETIEATLRGEADFHEVLPHYAVPELNGIGAQEIFVTTALGLCDFISAMDTARVLEWNCWYHLMNCGFPLKVSGETDFPCISGSRVGEGRVYVYLGQVERIDFTAWCEGLRQGRSYVSDGYAHAVRFTVNGKMMGERVELAQPGEVWVQARVAFARELPLGTAKGGAILAAEKRLVEIVVNGQAVARAEVPADDKIHDLEFRLPMARSSWVALRSFPQLHTNPVEVLVAGRPIRASRKSALWCMECIEQLWRARHPMIAPAERDEARRAFDRALEIYRQIAAECPPDS
ncbi:MAG: CehA/McbA family metallohydrolase [Gemmatales bacterium]|nr:CehA/McbA family metallohydrolase [Gemmatales bacterium]MDW7993352.1 CehA/McbA family metallohydrolase [Gemmatales bacterium]